MQKQVLRVQLLSKDSQREGTFFNIRNLRIRIAVCKLETWPCKRLIGNRRPKNKHLKIVATQGSLFDHSLPSSLVFRKFRIGLVLENQKMDGNVGVGWRAAKSDFSRPQNNMFFFKRLSDARSTQERKSFGQDLHRVVGD